MPIIKLNGIIDIIKFSRYLRNNSIWFTLHHVADDHISIHITIIDRRIEVDFYDDHVEYNHFDGSEGILTDQPRLFEMLRNFVEG